MLDPCLWNKIQSLQIGRSDAALGFKHRLARENGWSLAFADAVILEYKRFLYLAATSDQAMTPSDQVDQAWHLHLTYTRSYWQELCRGILGSELHHHPTLGGREEQARFRRQYLETLERYTHVFGEAPPASIWPPVDQRFAGGAAYVRINRSRVWLIPRPGPMLERAVLLTSLPILLVACTGDWASGDLWFWLKMAFGVFVVYKLFSWLGSGGRGGGGSCGSACSACDGCSGCGD